jgi:hypothetical protein
MTRYDIVEMAHLAGLVMPTGGATENQWRAFEQFAALVAEATRNSTWTQEHWTEYERGIAEAERDACAQVCEEVVEHPSLTPRHCAEAIRARGQA